MSRTELFEVLYFYMICTTIWMEVQTWSSDFLRAKGAFSDHGMQWMSGVCYAAFDVMTGLLYMDNCFPSLSFTHTGILHTSYYRVTDSQTHTQTHVGRMKWHVCKRIKIDAHKILKMGTALQQYWVQTSPGFLQDCKICNYARRQNVFT